MTEPSWSAELWSGIAPIYRAILDHPFLTGLAAGDLPAESFAYYIGQDAHYLHDYARALMIVGAKAPDHADAGMFARHAAGAVAVELALHTQLLADYGLDPDDLSGVAVAPTTRAYSSYLLAAAYGGTFAEGLAAVLPCYWIYDAVGRALVAQGSPEPRYQLWIDTYADDSFTEVVAEVLEVTDRTGAGLGAAEKSRAAEHFTTTARYEWMFWDAAWRRETWPV